MVLLLALSPDIGANQTSSRKAKLVKRLIDPVAS